MIPYLVRDGVPRDVKFILNSWLSSQSKVMGPLDYKAGYWQAMKAAAVSCIEDSRVLVAQDPLAPPPPSDVPEDEDEVVQKKRDDSIYGWVCGLPRRDGTVIHFAYTKHRQRGHGIAKDLVARLRSQSPSEKLIVTAHLSREMRARVLEEGATIATRLQMIRALAKAFPKEPHSETIDAPPHAQLP